MNQMEPEHGRLYAAYDRMTPAAAPLVFEAATTYTGDARTLENTRNYEWWHPLASIVGAILKAGLRLDALREHDRIPWRAFPHMMKAGECMFQLPPGAAKIPLAFSLTATKPG